jgi:hypothetical protein
MLSQTENSFVANSSSDEFSHPKLFFPQSDFPRNDVARSASSTIADSDFVMPDTSGLNSPKMTAGDLAGDAIGQFDGIRPAFDVVPGREVSQVATDEAQKRAIGQYGKFVEFDGRRVEILDAGDTRLKDLPNVAEGQFAIIDPVGASQTNLAKELWDKIPFLVSEDILKNPPNRVKSPFDGNLPTPRLTPEEQKYVDWMNDPKNLPFPGPSPKVPEGSPLIRDPRYPWGSTIVADLTNGQTYTREAFNEKYGIKPEEPIEGIDPRAGFSPQNSVVGVADFDLNGTNDFLLRNEQTGEMTIWHMTGINKTGEAPILNVAPPDYVIEGIGDFNGDGRADIAFRQFTGAGNVAIWFLGGASGNQVISAQFVPGVFGNGGWQADAIADFNNDGKADFLWRNQSSGTAVIYYMNGTSVVGSSFLPPVPGNSGWQIVGAGKIDNNATQDIFWRNSITGENAYWLMNPGYGSASQTPLLPTIGDPNWKIETVGDINSDGKPDLVWEYPGWPHTSWVTNPNSNSLPVPNGPLLPFNIGTASTFSVPFTFSQYFGHGLIDVQAALANLTGQPTSQEIIDPIAFNPISTTYNNTRQNELVNLPEAWAQGYTGQGVTVAVIDDAVLTSHFDLDANIVAGFDFRDGDNNPNPNFSNETHGTFVAGVIAAELANNGGVTITGGAYNARIMPLRISTTVSSSTPNNQHPFWQAGNAVRYAADNGAAIANMSLGLATALVPSAVINKLTQDVQYAVSRGVVVVISAGNSGTASTVDNQFPASLATLPGVIVVGATNAGNFGDTSGNNATNKVAVFSTSAGTSVKRYVTAPGDSIRSTSFGINSNNEAVPNYTNDAGTSFSAPIVAAAAAILRQASPNAAPEAIVNALLQTADSSGLYL